MSQDMAAQGLFMDLMLLCKTPHNRDQLGKSTFDFKISGQLRTQWCGAPLERAMVENNLRNLHVLKIKSG